jgi:hypothetical protein
MLHKLAPCSWAACQEGSTIVLVRTAWADGYPSANYLWRNERFASNSRSFPDFVPQLIMVGQAGSPCLDVWSSQGLRSAREAFADRAYERDGTLRHSTLRCVTDWVWSTVQSWTRSASEERARCRCVRTARPFSRRQSARCCPHHEEFAGVTVIESASLHCQVRRATD